MQRIDGKVAWVVGASGAIGAAVATTLADQGASVWATGRNLERLGGVVDAITLRNGVARLLPVDTRQGDQVEHAVQQIIARDSRIDILVNSTAVGIAGDFLKLTDDDWLAVLDSKLLSYVRTMRAVLPHMIGAGGGCIVNISGRGGRQPSAAHLAGGSANAAVTLLTKGISESYRQHHIRANTVLPGPIKSLRADLIKGSNDALASGAFGWDRVGEPQDVANAVAWLVSSGSGHVNGAAIAVDGGGTATV